MAVKVFINQGGYLVLAIVVLALTLPFLPTRLLIQPQSITVVGDQVIYDRTVTVPVTGHWIHEVERITPPPPVAALECSRSGTAHYERRTTPLIYAHDCDFSGPAGSVWLYRSCVSAQVFGLELRPTCITTTFQPGEPRG